MKMEPAEIAASKNGSRAGGLDPVVLSLTSRL